jgi:hypothetical protein
MLVKTISNDCLAHIFSYLDLPDLGRVAPVCKRWNEVQKSESCWKEFCDTHVGALPPYRGSHKGRVQVYANWRKKRFTCTPYHSYGRLDRFTVLDDSTLFEIISQYSPYPEHPHQYIVRNILTKKEICEIDLQKVGNSFLVAENLNGTIWTVLDKQGKVYHFNILDGTYSSDIQGAPCQNDSALLHCTDQELITMYNDQITVWNRETNTIEQTIDTSTLYIGQITSTPHFIIVSAVPFEKASTKLSVLSIRKKDLKLEVLEENVDWWRSLDSLGNTCALLSTRGEVKTFKDESEESLVISHTFTLKPAYSGEYLHIHITKNWLGVARYRSVHLWDLETGNKILKQRMGKEFRTDFRTNGEVLCTQELSKDSHGYDINIYRLYDFRVGLNAPQQAPKKSFLQRCVTWLRKQFQTIRE